MAEVTYQVVRRYRDHQFYNIMAVGLTLDEAQRHCSDPGTSSSTCTTVEGRARTATFGPWFDGYEEE